MSATSLSREAYTVGWITILSVEFSAARAMLDKEYPPPRKPYNDPYTYATGSVNGHNVVIACSGEAGIAPASYCASQMMHTFPKIKIGLLSGIGGGVPSAKHDIRLGDVVVSKPGQAYGGVAWYDAAKLTDDGLEPSGHLDRPPPVLRQAVTRLESNLELGDSQFYDYLANVKPADLISINHLSDELYEAGDVTKIVKRDPRPTGARPVIHHGLIASGSWVIKTSGSKRNDLVRRIRGDVLCFEMEAAGLMNTFPCLVVRGISDYCDSHKNDGWHKYASTTAACYCKWLLKVITASGMESTPLATITTKTVTNYGSEQIRRKPVQRDMGDQREISAALDYKHPPRNSKANAAEQELLEHFRINVHRAQEPSQRRHQESWVRDEIPIGSGAFGTVYMERSNFGVRVRAVKQVTKQRGLDCQKELLALTRLSKPAYQEYFAQFLGWYEDLRTISFVMEYFRMGDLRRHISEPIPEKDAQDIAFQLFSGLEIMHSDGFAHRDLKPENIFVVQQSPHWNIKIGDFGVAKRVKSDEASLRTEVGTSAYKAPEVLYLIGEETEYSSYTNAIDVWAAGIIIYEILCAQRPFPNLGVLKSYCRQRIHFPVDPLFSQGVGPDAVHLVQWVLRSAPSSRPSAAAALKSTWLASDAPSNNFSNTEKLQSGSGPGSTSLKIDINSVPKVEAAAFTAPTREDTTIYRALSEKHPGPLQQKAELTIKKGPLPIREPAHTVKVPTADNLPKPADNGSKSNRERTPMHEAAFYGQIAMVDHLRSKGHDIGIKSNIGETPLHYAAANGQIAMIDHLLSLGQDIQVRSKNGLTLVHEAAYNGHIAVVDHLRSLGLDLGSKTDNGRTPLYIAAGNGKVAMIDHLRKLGQDVRAGAVNGAEPMHEAAHNGHIAVIDHFHSLGLDLGSRTDDGRSPLYVAAANGQITMIVHLRKLGQDIGTRAFNGMGPMHEAAYKGLITMIDYLHSQGQDLGLKSNNGRTPMHLAACNGQTATITHLRKLGQDIGVTTPKGEAPIHEAAFHGHVATVDYLRTLGQDIGLRGEDGQTPMHKAAYNGQIAMVDYLHELGQDIGVKSSTGQTPMLMAARNGQIAMIDHLTKLSAEDSG